METTTVSNWDELELKENLLRGIYSFGFEKPSPIQAKSIGPIMSGKDVIAQAQSGTGKTGAFSIGCLSRIDIANPNIQAIVVAPTRELAEQTKYVFGELSQQLGVKAYLCIGGTSVNQDIEGLNQGV